MTQNNLQQPLVAALCEIKLFFQIVIVFDFFSFLFYYFSAYGAWPSGKATGFDPVIRRFESFRPSQPF